MTRIFCAKQGPFTCSQENQLLISRWDLRYSIKEGQCQQAPVIDMMYVKAAKAGCYGQEIYSSMFLGRALATASQAHMCKLSEVVYTLAKEEIPSAPLRWKDSRTVGVASVWIKTDWKS